MFDPTKKDNIVVFGSCSDTELESKIKDRIGKGKADAAILGQYPYLNLGFVDPVSGDCDFPNAEAFAVTEDCYTEIGPVDKLLRSARAADYLLRLKNRGKKAVMATDLAVKVSPTCSLTEAWVDSLMLRYKYADKAGKKEMLSSIISAVKSYDSAIGNYSRKELLTQLPHILKCCLFYVKDRSGEAKVPEDYFYLSRIRGSSMLDSSDSEGEAPLVSLILRTHERPDVLRMTLNNLRRLDYGNYEIILIEDGRPTSKEMIEREYDDLPIRYHSTVKNVGRAAAANVGFSLANGEWINLIDDDDFFFPEHLRVAVDAASGSGADMVFLQAVALEVDAGKDPYRIAISKMHHMDFPHIDVFSMVSECKTADNGVMFKKALLSGCGYMREDLQANEDWSLWLRLMTKAKWIRVPYATCMFVNPASAEEKEKRETAYSKFDGLQFDDPVLVYSTSSSDAEQYFLNLMHDMSALEEEGTLDNYLKKVNKRYPYDETVLKASLEEWFSVISGNCTDTRFTARQFHQWYCAACAALLKTVPSERKKVIDNWIKEKGAN